jgi:hypothetical protein
MPERVTALLRRIEHDANAVDDLTLADNLIEALRPKRGIVRVVIGIEGSAGDGNRRTQRCFRGVRVSLNDLVPGHVRQLSPCADRVEHIEVMNGCRSQLVIRPPTGPSRVRRLRQEEIGRQSGFVHSPPARLSTIPVGDVPSVPADRET